MAYSGDDKGSRIQAGAARSVAGLGVDGPFGPRGGSSVGVWPGNSSGRGGSPGSRIGGGASGCGLPGGSSCGGSVGVPGVGGGISGGSIGFGIGTPAVEFNNKGDKTRFQGKHQ